jgi:hypothetical protein
LGVLDRNKLGFNYTGTQPASGIEKYDWNWGDGTSNTVTTGYTEHFFPAIPKDTFYDVQLTATSNNGKCSNSATRKIAIPAKYKYNCEIIYSSTNPCIANNEVFTFRAKDSLPVANKTYYWDFGDYDKQNALTHIINKRYTRTGNNDVTLVIRVNHIDQCQNKTPITSFGQSKLFNIDYANVATSATLATSVDTKFETNITKYNGYVTKHKLYWNFGDGSIDSSGFEFIPSYLYNRQFADTVYKPTLKVVMAVGLSTKFYCEDSMKTPPIFIPKL